MLCPGVRGLPAALPVGPAAAAAAALPPPQGDPPQRGGNPLPPWSRPSHDAHARCVCVCVCARSLFDNQEVLQHTHLCPSRSPLNVHIYVYTNGNHNTWTVLYSGKFSSPSSSPSQVELKVAMLLAASATLLPLLLPLLACSSLLPLVAVVMAVLSSSSSSSSSSNSNRTGVPHPNLAARPYP